MKYFKYFPKLDYDLDDNNQTREVVDVFRFAKIINAIEDNVTFYREYDIQDGERPDHVSQKLYGSVDYHWTFFIANPQMKSLYKDWPRSREEMDDLIAETYDNYMLNIGFFNPADSFEVGEVVEGSSSGAKATIVSKNVHWIEIASITGESFDFQNGENINGETSGDSIIIGTTIEDTGSSAKLTITAFDFYDKFTVGETVQGLISGATATIVSKNSDLGWIKVSDRSKAFRAGEIVRGLVSGDFITIEAESPEKYAAHHYEKDGLYVPRTTPLAAKVTFEQNELDINDAKKEIRVIRPEYISRVAAQFREAINE